jgi:hypothetical protein
MGQWSDVSAAMLAPSENGRALAGRLSGTGTTEATNSTALSAGSLATIVVGPAAVYVRFLSAAGGGSSVTSANYDVEVAAGMRFDWTVEAGNKHVAIEASDGSSAYRATVWTSSPSL